MKQLFLIPIAALFLISCQNDDTAQPVTAIATDDIIPEVNDTVTIAFDEVQHSDLSGINGFPGGNFVIINSAEWDAFRTPQYYGNLLFTNITIDFDAKTVIAVMDVRHGELGWDVSINSIKQVHDTLRVAVERVSLPDGEPGLTMESQPYYIATISKNTLPVVFE